MSAQGDNVCAVGSFVLCGAAMMVFTGELRGIPR